MGLFTKQPKPLLETDPETRDLSLGQLFEAAVNTDTLLTVGVGRLSTNDQDYLRQQARRIDDELERRGQPRYADL